MIDNKKVSSYLLYAVGEVFLVVLGILIAVQIGNWNKQKEKQQTTITYLRQIQEELLGDIREAESLEPYFLSKDSILNMIMTGEVTRAMYEQKENGFRHAITNFWTFLVEDNGYQNFLNNFEQVPKEYENITKALEACYGLTEEIHLSNEHNRKNSADFMNHLKLNIPTHHLFYFKDSIGSAEIDYYLNNPAYKNWVSRYALSTWALFGSTQDFRFRALNAYREIHKALSDTSVLPKEITKVLTDTTRYDYRHLQGKYQAEQLSNQRYNFEIVLVEGKPYQSYASTSYSPERLTPLYHITDSTFTTDGVEQMKINGNQIHVKVNVGSFRNKPLVFHKVPN